MTAAAQAEREVQVGELGEALARLRVLDERTVRAMRESLVRHGQLVPLTAYVAVGAPGAVEVIDGFKRLRAARELGLGTLRARVLCVEPAAAKAAMRVLNEGHGLSALEEAWLVRSLHREDGLTQPTIGRLLGRHKSWVSRRLLMCEELDEVVQADVRLGLLAARTAEALARLPRGNQREAAEAVMQHGLTHAQTERLAAQVLSRPEGERTAALREAVAKTPQAAVAAQAPDHPRPQRTAAQWLLADIATLTRISARLQARLLAQPIAVADASAARLLGDALAAAAPVLAALCRTIDHTLEGRHAAMDDAHRA